MPILRAKQRTSLHFAITLLSSQTSRQQWRALHWDLVVIGEVELGAIVVDVGRELSRERATLGSGGDGGGRTGSNCDGYG